MMEGESTMKFSINEAQSDVISEFASVLVMGAAAAHVHHWNTIGPGSFAAHEAMGEFYDKLPDLADSVIEACLQDESKIFLEKQALFVGETPLALVEYIQARVKEMRQKPGFPQDSEVQNLVDGIGELCRHTIFKLKRLK
jgi:DNA-binding ferritin-like protein